MKSATSEPSTLLVRVFHPRHRRRLAPLDASAVLAVLSAGALYVFVHLPMIQQPGIRVDLPPAPTLDGLPYIDAKIVTLTAEGRIFFEDQPYSLSGLRDTLRAACQRTPDLAVLIEADGRVSTEALVELYRLAAEAGLRHVTLATRPSATEPEAR